MRSQYQTQIPNSKSTTGLQKTINKNLYINTSANSLDKNSLQTFKVTPLQREVVSRSILTQGSVEPHYVNTDEQPDAPKVSTNKMAIVQNQNKYNKNTKTIILKQSAVVPGKDVV